MTTILDLLARYASGPALGTGAILLFLGLRYVHLLPAKSRKAEAAAVLTMIGSAVLGAWQLGQTNVGALLGIAGQAALFALLCRIRALDIAPRATPEPPRTEDDEPEVQILPPPMPPEGK